MTVKAVIWDVGGVLLRTEDPHPRQQLAERFGMERAALEELVFWGESGSEAQLGKKNYEQHLRDVLAFLDLGPDEFQHFEHEFWGGDRIDFGLVEDIRALHRDSIKTGLLSNAFSNLRELLTSEWKISDAFDAMVISAEVGLVKPDSRIYQLALDSLNVPPKQAIFIDDFAANIDAAQRLSMHAIQFKSTEQVRSELNQLIKDTN